MKASIAAFLGALLLLSSAALAQGSSDPQDALADFSDFAARVMEGRKVREDAPGAGAIEVVATIEIGAAPHGIRFSNDGEVAPFLEAAESRLGRR